MVKERYTYVTDAVGKTLAQWYREFILIDNSTLETYKGCVVNRIEDEEDRDQDAIYVELTYSDLYDPDGTLLIEDEALDFIICKESENLNHCDCQGLNQVKELKQKLINSLYEVENKKDFVSIITKVLEEV